VRTTLSAADSVPAASPSLRLLALTPKHDSLRSGAALALAMATLPAAPCSAAGSEVEAESTSAATSGHVFRYSSRNDLYTFNLSTSGLSVGTWQLRIDLGDGVPRTVNISLH
jgi:hypothetical protein